MEGQMKVANKIQTFVFMDLETTGLPRDGNPKITELAMIAISREDLIAMRESAFKNDNDSLGPSTSQSSSLPSSSPSASPEKVPVLPRVLHKYIKLFYPWTLIKPVVEDITGLSNEKLQHLSAFKGDAAKSVNLFLDFPQPICLVAHNGNRYDFPLFKAELGDSASLENLAELLCTDTLKAIKDIDAYMERLKMEESTKDESDLQDVKDCDEKVEVDEITKLAEEFDFEDDLEEEVMEEDLPTIKRARSDELLPPALQMTPELLLTPIKNHVPPHVRMPATPLKAAQPSTSPVTPETHKIGSTPGPEIETLQQTTKVKRSLSYEGPGKRKFNGQRTYKLSDIYKRLFQNGYAAHRAESDCQAMLEICGSYGKVFVEWADNFAEKFVDIKPMWVRRKCFTDK